MELRSKAEIEQKLEDLFNKKEVIEIEIKILDWILKKTDILFSEDV